MLSDMKTVEAMEFLLGKLSRTKNNREFLDSMSMLKMFTDRISRIQPSATLAMTSKAAELKRENKPVYNMSVGEPDFSTPENIQLAGIEAIQNGYTKYTPGGGTFELKQAIIKKLKRDNNLNYTKEEIVVSCGGKHSLYNACQALFQTGDEVIIFKPFWVSFPDFVTVTSKASFVEKLKIKNKMNQTLKI